MQNIGDFLSEYFSHITLSVEILAAVTGLVLFKKYQDTAAKYFIYFLIYIVFIVVISRYSHLVKDGGILGFLDGTILEKNYWWYTIFWDIIGVIFFGWYYLKILKNDFGRMILRFSLIIFIIASILIILFNINQFFTNSLPSINVLGALLITQCVFFYFMEILQTDKILTFYKSLNFYISCAILLLWLIQTPLAFFQPYYRLLDMEYINLRNYINLFVISFMYITYTVGLIISKPEYD